MITKMTGVLTRVLEDEARLQVGPFEYQVLVPESVRRVIQMRVGNEITFHVTEYLEGNAGGNRFVPRRLGFLTEAEVEFFDLFCTVEKIGAKKALKAMARPVKEIADAISRQDARWLSTLPGIGATTAEQIVTTLKRKVTRFAVMSQPAPEPPPPDAVTEAKATGRRKAVAEAPPAAAQPVAVDGQVIDDVYQALMGLGLNPLEARSKLDSLLTSGKPFKTVSDALTLIYGTKG
jgi:Holliday junction DNA helicase RuvA